MDIHRRSFLAGLSALLAPVALVSEGMFSGGKVLAAEKDGTLIIGFTTEPSSIDPHWHLVSQNNSVAQHIFDRVVHADPDQRPIPGLATGWRVIDDLTWEFAIRDGVKFHNGDLLQIEDIIFSCDRAQNVPGAIFNMRAYLSGKTFEKVDERTLRVRTDKPNPIVPGELATCSIISRKVGASATTADYNNGSAAIGTGPYRFVESVPGNQIVLERNEQYWGAKPDWKRVVIKPIPVGGSRVAAVQSGSADVIDNVPPADVTHLAKANGIGLARGVANRVVFLSMDQGRSTSPFVRAVDGGEIRNVFLDRRVREAVSLAIDRVAIAQRVLEDNGVPAAQIVPDSIFGASPNIKLPAVDRDRAKALLTEAGLPNGFRVTLHGPNDRFIRDAAVVQAVAQMLSRIGIQAAVETMPSSVFYRRATAGGPEGGSEFSFFLVGYGASTGDISPSLRNVIHTPDTARGFGSNNRLRYSNPEIDALIEKGMVTLDDEKRRAIYAKASELVVRDVAIVPLYFPVNVWAMRNPVKFAGRSDERTLAMDMHV